MRTVSVFVDTNAFIQLRDLQDIPWSDVYRNFDRVDLIVTPPIVRELEGFKTGTADRLRDRSRKALRQIDEAMDCDDRAIILKSNTPEVRLVVMRINVNWTKFPDLDPLRVDDQIVAMAATHGSAVVFSHDRGPRIAARDLEIDTLKPAEEWHLPAERSANERQLQELRRQINERYPSISLTVEDRENDQDVFEFAVPIVPALNDEQVEERVARFLGLHPRARLTRQSFNMGPMGISSHEIADYEEAYDRFKRAVRNYFQKHHLTLAQMARVVPLRYRVASENGVSAQGLRIETRTRQDGVILGDWQEAWTYHTKLCPLPVPPKRPRGILDLTYPTISSAWQKPDLHRDPVAFYWQSDPESGAKFGALQCQDFRAQRVFDDEIIVAVAKPTDRAELEISVSATNMSDRINRKATFRLVEREVNWDDPLVGQVTDRFKPAEDDEDD